MLGTIGKQMIAAFAVGLVWLSVGAVRANPPVPFCGEYYDEDRCDDYYTPDYDEYQFCGAQCDFALSPPRCLNPTSGQWTEPHPGTENNNFVGVWTNTGYYGDLVVHDYENPVLCMVRVECNNVCIQTDPSDPTSWECEKTTLQSYGLTRTVIVERDGCDQ